jgi:hypothetical protein
MKVHKKLGGLLLLIFGSLLLSGCPIRSPLIMSAQVSGIPRVGSTFEVITTIQNVVVEEEAQIELNVSDGLHIIGESTWIGTLEVSVKHRQKFKIRVDEAGLHRIRIYAHNISDHTQYGDSDGIWIRSWDKFGLRIPEWLVRDRFGRFRSIEAEETYQESIR